MQHLQQYQEYPSTAKIRGVEGVAMLKFSVDRNGRVLAHEIVRSSGYPELDEAVMSMVDRAEPLPPFPPSMPEEKLDLTVPIRFSNQPASAEPTDTSTTTTTTTPTAPSAPIPPFTPSPAPSSNQQITIVLQRPSVPGGPWTLRQGSTVRQVAESSIGPEARALLGNDLTETLIGHVDPDGKFHVDGRVR